jgi:hypothetical protein
MKWSRKFESTGGLSAKGKSRTTEWENAKKRCTKRDGTEVGRRSAGGRWTGDVTLGSLEVKRIPSFGNSKWRVPSLGLNAPGVKVAGVGSFNCDYRLSRDAMVQWGQCRIWDFGLWRLLGGSGVELVTGLLVDATVGVGPGTETLPSGLPERNLAPRYNSQDGAVVAGLDDASRTRLTLPFSRHEP